MSYNKDKDIIDAGNKVAGQSIKQQVLTNYSYILNFMYYSSGTLIGLSKDQKERYNIILTYTVVSKIVRRFLRQLEQLRHPTVFTDNYFTSTKLFKALRDLGVSVTSTVRKI